MMKVLLIDDDKEYGKSLVRFAQVNDIKLFHYQNYEAGFEEIRRNPTIQALIFDAKCWKTKAEQEEEVEPSEDALSLALTLLAEYEKSTGKFLPIAVNTGYNFPLQYFKPLLTPFQARIFEKGKTDPEELFGHLKERIQHSESYQIERQYADVFEVFEKGYLGQSEKNDLLNILKSKNGQDISEITKTIALIRTIEEKIRKNPSVAKIKKNELIKASNSMIATVANNYGSHNYLQDGGITTYYTVKSLTYALLEILLWYKNERENS
jgi:hypothetical protein